MRNLVLVVHTSLDGFVASPTGELNGFDAGEENLQFVCKLTENADAALFGRISYKLLNDYWPQARDLPGASEGTLAYSNWYNEAEKIVVSKTLREPQPKTLIIDKDVIATIRNIKQGKGKDILIFGSPSIAQLLMEEELIDNFWVFINPALFGEGIPLFKHKTTGQKLKLIATHRFPNGELALNYLPIR